MLFHFLIIFSLSFLFSVTQYQYDFNFLCSLIGSSIFYISIEDCKATILFAYLLVFCIAFSNSVYEISHINQEEYMIKRPSVVWVNEDASLKLYITVSHIDID